MQTSPHCDTDVLIAGAGPTGLVLALWLARLGVRLRILEKAAQAGTTSRAIGVQARTLEFYAQLGIADPIVAQGRWTTAANLWSNGRRRVHLEFGSMGTALSPFPSVLIYPQDQHERFLIACLADLGITIERQTELIGFQHADRAVRAQILRPDGTREYSRAAYIAGCDGAHSTVRNRLGIGFPGGTYEHLFYVADVEAQGPAVNGEVNVAFDRQDFAVVFPLKDTGRVRLVGIVRDELNRRDDLSWDDVRTGVLDRLHMSIARVNWFSTYRVHHRVADRFRSGRVYLLGDAAHIHSPVGAQGMNTGIGDAVNLAWKLAAVLNGANESLLDSYQQERIAFAQRLVSTTDRVFTEVTSSRISARLLRLRLAPLFAPWLFSSASARQAIFRTISQISIEYRQSRISRGIAGHVRGGDRLPWIRLDYGGDNFAPLSSLQWQVHVYGAAKPELRALSQARRLPLHVFPYAPAMRRAGLRENAAYLLRPDGYVALAEPDGLAEKIAAYLDQLSLFPS